MTNNPNAVVMLSGNRVGVIIDSPTFGRQIAVIDARDYPRVAGHRWFVKENGRTFYARANARREDGSRRVVLMHRLLVDSAEIDHIDRDGMNNVRSNLRETTHRDNLINRRTWGVSPYRGVTKQGAFWKAQIAVKGRVRHVGLFLKPEHAAYAFNRAAILLGYPETSLNADLPPLTDAERVEERFKRLEASLDKLSVDIDQAFALVA